MSEKEVVDTLYKRVRENERKFSDKENLFFYILIEILRTLSEIEKNLAHGPYEEWKIAENKSKDWHY